MQDPKIQSPSDDEKAIENIVLTRLLRLNATILGLIGGFVGGLIIFVATIWLLLKGGPVVGPHLSLLGEFFFGYTVTWYGSLIGFAYGFVSGFVVGYLIATVYNWLSGLREKRRSN